MCGRVSRDEAVRFDKASIPRSFSTAVRRGQRGKRNNGEDRALRGKGRRVMRSRLVHEWHDAVDGWYFVPFQTRRKPRRQDFGVRLKSCRLNLRLPNQPSTLHNPSVVFSPRLTPFRTLILLTDVADVNIGRPPPRRSTSRGKAPWLPPFSNFYFDRRTVECLRKLTAAKSKGWCHRRRRRVLLNGEVMRVRRLKCSFSQAALFSAWLF